MSVDAVRAPAWTAFHPVDGEPGVRFRPWGGLGDIPGMAVANHAVRDAAGMTGRFDVHEMEIQYRTIINCDLDRDLAIIEADGETIGYSRVVWSEQTDGSREYELVGIVRPDWAGRGIEPALVAWSEARRTEIATGHGAEAARGHLGAFTFDGVPHLPAALEVAGYLPDRRSYEMARPDLRDIVIPPMPPGIEVRPAGPEDVRAVWEAMNEAFEDHPGEREDTEEHWEQFAGHPDLDPSGWVVAFDGAAVAGAVLTVTKAAPADAEDLQGWLAQVFVRARWRRRGLATALIARALDLVRNRGAHRALLGVEGANPNQAMTVYEQAGFRVTSSSTHWTRPLPPQASPR